MKRIVVIPVLLLVVMLLAAPSPAPAQSGLGVGSHYLFVSNHEKLKIGENTTALTDEWLGQLYVATADGAELRRITELPPGLIRRLSVNGDDLYFTHSDQVTETLYRVNWRAGWSSAQVLHTLAHPTSKYARSNDVILYILAWIDADTLLIPDSCNTYALLDADGSNYRIVESYQGAYDASNLCDADRRFQTWVTPSREYAVVSIDTLNYGNDDEAIEVQTPDGPLLLMAYPHFNWIELPSAFHIPDRFGATYRVETENDPRPATLGYDVEQPRAVLFQTNPDGNRVNILRAPQILARAAYSVPAQSAQLLARPNGTGLIDWYWFDETNGSTQRFATDQLPARANPTVMTSYGGGSIYVRLDDLTLYRLSVTDKTLTRVATDDPALTIFPTLTSTPDGPTTLPVLLPDNRTYSIYDPLPTSLLNAHPDLAASGFPLNAVWRLGD